jgi:uncharacterized Zn finger protein (UPF0148 family)
MSNNDDRIVFVCGCRCRSFFLYQDGNISCANCDTETFTENNARWAAETKDISPEVQGDDSGTTNVRSLGRPEIARRHTMKEINNWSSSDNLAMVIAYNVDGSGKQWLDIQTQEQKDWCIQKLEELLKIIKVTSV